MPERPLGFLLGKFLPPHRGHEYLARFARAFMGEDELIVLLCSIQAEPIPGAQRLAWLREILPGFDLRHCSEELPQLPEQHPDFWQLWRGAILRHCGRAPSHVFASEPYGQRLAAELGARFVPVDIGRELLPVSGSAIRSDPAAHWAWIPEAVRPAFVRRIAVLGPESAGKTTLSRRLAERFGASWVHEWARPFYDWKGLDIRPEDMPLIARGQDAAIRARERSGGPLLIADTDGVTTCTWSQQLFGHVDPEVEAIAAAQRFELSLVLEPDAPWTDDGQRVMPERQQREAFTAALCARLQALDRPHLRIGGDWSQRQAQAETAILDLLAQPAAR